MKQIITEFFKSHNDYLMPDKYRIFYYFRENIENDAAWKIEAQKFLDQVKDIDTKGF